MKNIFWLQTLYNSSWMIDFYLSRLHHNFDSLVSSCTEGVKIYPSNTPIVVPNLETPNIQGSTLLLSPPGPDHVRREVRRFNKGKATCTEDFLHIMDDEIFKSNAASEHVR